MAGQTPHVEQQTVTLPGHLRGLLCCDFPKQMLQCKGDAVFLSLSRYAYIEFEDKSSVKAAVELDESMFRGRVIKVKTPGPTGARQE